jgi:hypothetical protein
MTVNEPVNENVNLWDYADKIHEITQEMIGENNDQRSDRIINMCYGVAQDMLLDVHRITTLPEDLPDTSDGIIVGICNFEVDLQRLKLRFGHIGTTITGNRAVLLIENDLQDWHTNDDERHSLYFWGVDDNERVDPRSIRIGTEVRFEPDWILRLRN